MRAFISATLVLSLLMAQAQGGTRALRFMPLAGDHALKLDEQSVLPDGKSFRITTLRFYVGVPFAPNGGQSFLLPYEYHLVDAADTSTWTIAVPARARYLLLGVDSLTNVSGALSGDLDPTKGMYWTWNSGYINLKLEGSSPDREVHLGQFEFHLGGYLPPFAGAQRIELPATMDGSTVLRFDLAEFFAKVDLRSEHNVMSPSERAVYLARIAASAFHVEGARP
ncbi:MAG: hypothetical protein KDB84_00855 [Flavobacteriales bacterium]|nr:hypothetical protein [Flavobacteriales bacterium]